MNEETVLKGDTLSSALSEVGVWTCFHISEEGKKYGCPRKKGNTSFLQVSSKLMLDIV